MKKTPHSRWWHYGVALLATAVALGLTWPLLPLVGSRVYPLFFAAVLVSAGVGGWGPGVAAALLGAVAVDWFLIEPSSMVHLARPGDAAAMGLFLLVSGLIITVTEAYRSARGRSHESEERYRALVQASSQAVWRLNAQGQPLEPQDWWPALTGQSEGESSDWGWLEAVHPEDRERVRAAWLEALKTRMPFEAQYRIHSRSGEWQPLEVRGIPLWDDTGCFREWVGTVTDLTERQRTEARLRFLAEAGEVLASSLDYQTTLSSVACLAVPQIGDWCSIEMLGEDGAIRNLAVAHIDPAKVEWARQLRERYPPDPNEPRGLPQVLRTGRPELYAEIPDALLVEVARDVEHLQLLREVGFASAMIVPLAAHSRTLGAISFISTQPSRRYSAQDLALAEDLARRAGLAIDNSRLYREVQEADQRKDEFLALLGHELRSPLGALKGTLALLERRSADSPEWDRLRERMQRQAARMARLIDDMQDVTRITRGKLSLRCEPLDLVPLIEHIVADQRAALENTDLALTAELPTGPVRVDGDPDRLAQMLVNLINNAVKFTDAGGRIIVGLQQEGEWATITVNDTGIGIEAAMLPHVFDSFAQAERSLERTRGGLGLGLALVKGLVELHGGEVRAVSAGLGCGAEFIVRLPLREPPESE